MANNRIYANFLMHGRTKGSRNGVSTTKGYTAVGQKAKGKLVNGKYVYDIPTAYSNGTEMIRDGKVVYETPSVPAGVAVSPKKKTDWAKEAASYDNHVTSYPKQGYDSLMMEKRNKWLAGGPMSQGAKNNWQQQAADAQRKAEAKVRWNAGHKAQVAKKSIEQGAARGDAQQAALAQLRKQNQNNVASKKKAQQAYDSAAKGAANNWQQQAAYQQQKDAVRNRAAESAAKGAANDWQSKANAARAMTEYGRNATEARKAKESARSASYNKMSSTQKNAMQGDPRYTSNNPGPLNTSRDPKYGYSGKNDSRAPVFKEITMIDMYGNKTGGKETKMNRDPYFESWAKATNKQETAKAQAGNKAFMNAFEESKKRNSRSDIGNAVADFKEEAKAKAKSLFKKKKKK